MKKETLEKLFNPRFFTVLQVCMEDEELMQNFERLCGVKRPTPALTPLDRMIDNATGYKNEQLRVYFEAVVNFVYECVWLTWKDRDNELVWTTERPA